MNAFDLQRWEKFCDREVMQQATITDTQKQVSETIWNGISDHGFFGLFHEDSDGKLPVTGPVLYRAMEALAEACASTFWTATISSALCGRMIAELCGQSLRNQWVPQLSNGQALG